MKLAAKLFVIIALTASAVAAVAQNAQHGSDSTKEFKAADMNMMKNMNAAPYTGNPDVDFRTHMIPHHEGAIAMAKVGLKYANDAETKRMAQKIILSDLRSHTLKNFKIDWNSSANQCLEVKSEFDETVLMGTCVLSFSAFQVNGHIALTKKANGSYSVSVIHADVE